MARWELTDAARLFLETGEVEQPFAVDNRSAGRQLSDTDLMNLYGPEAVGEAESPSDSAAPLT